MSATRKRKPRAKVRPVAPDGYRQEVRELNLVRLGNNLEERKLIKQRLPIALCKPGESRHRDLPPSLPHNINQPDESNHGPVLKRHQS